MKVIKIWSDGRYTHHGIGYTDHDGYGGTADNRMPIKSAIRYEMRCILPGESYMTEINGKIAGPFVKTD